MSHRLCETCGNSPAKLFGYWRAVLCLVCAQKRVDAQRQHSPDGIENAEPAHHGGFDPDSVRTSQKLPAEHVRSVPNVDESTGDNVLAPMTITVPMVLIENDAGDRYWHHEPMDRSAADRFVEAIRCGGNTASIVDVPLIMPWAGGIVDVLSQLDCQPIRADITETVTENLYERTLQELRANANFVLCVKSEEPSDGA